MSNFSTATYPEWAGVPRLSGKWGEGVGKKISHELNGNGESRPDYTLLIYLVWL